MTSRQYEPINIDLELGRYPPKTTKPLLEKGWLNGLDMDAILRVGKMNNYPCTLLGFTCVYLAALRDKAPIQDTIKMANLLNRPFNMSWSSKRIKEEHTKLSRMMTLRALAQNNQVFDVEFMASKCSKTFKGYWIKSSRRLGMEGLRQRHCVASYGYGIENKQYAIASVFEGGRRWTVQVTAGYGDQENPHITQIQGRSGRLPGKATQIAIMEQMGIEQDMHTSDRINGDDRSELMAKIRKTCQAAGIKEANIEFYGGGDEGSFDMPTIVPDIPDEEIGDVREPLEVPCKALIDGKWVASTKMRNIGLREALRELSSSIVAETGIDWFNGDGGGGEINYDFEKGVYELRVDECYTETETVLSSTRDMMTDDPV